MEVEIVLFKKCHRTLHKFRYRCGSGSGTFKKMPTFKPTCRSQLSGVRIAKEDRQKVFAKLPSLPADHGDYEGDDLELEDRVRVKFLGKKIVEGTVAEIEECMNAAFLKYDLYTECYNEYHPYHQLREPRPGEESVVIRPEDVKVGKIVTNRWGDKGEVSRLMFVCEDLQVFGCCKIVTY